MHLSIYKQNTLGEINRIVLIMAGETSSNHPGESGHGMTNILTSQIGLMNVLNKTLSKLLKHYYSHMHYENVGSPGLLTDIIGSFTQTVDHVIASDLRRLM